MMYFELQSIPINGTTSLAPSEMIDAIRFLQIWLINMLQIEELGRKVVHLEDHEVIRG